MDDEEQILEMIDKMLGRLGHIATIARNGEEAIQLYKQSLETGNKFDAVILDLTIKEGMGGQETCERLLNLDPTVCAIVTSGHSDSPMMNEFKEYGFKAALAKPTTIHHLKESLKKVFLEQVDSQ